MITEQEAEKLVWIHISGYELPKGDEWIIVQDETIRKDWGWVFFYTSKKWRETGDLSFAVAGNAPLLIEKNTGNVLVTGTARETEYYIKNYEATGNPNG